jgi:hypothetical protein
MDTLRAFAYHGLFLEKQQPKGSGSGSVSVGSASEERRSIFPPWLCEIWCLVPLRILEAFRTLQFVVLFECAKSLHSWMVPATLNQGGIEFHSESPFLEEGQIDENSLS